MIMEQVLQALGLTALFTIGFVTIVGGIMWGLYWYFNRFLNRDNKEEQGK
jgi:hypothetical protein